MVSNIFHVSMLEMYSVPNYIHKLIHEITSTLYLYYERMKVFLTDIYVGRHISSQFKAQYNKCCLSSLSNF